MFDTLLHTKEKHFTITPPVKIKINLFIQALNSFCKSMKFYYILNMFNCILSTSLCMSHQGVCTSQEHSYAYLTEEFWRHRQGECTSQEHFLCLPYGGVLMVGHRQGVRATQESFLCLLMEFWLIDTAREYVLIRSGFYTYPCRGSGRHCQRVMYVLVRSFSLLTLSRTSDW